MYFIVSNSGVHSSFNSDSAYQRICSDSLDSFHCVLGGSSISDVDTCYGLAFRNHSHTKSGELQVT